MAKIICIIEPLSSANYLATRLKQEGFQIIAVRIHNNPNAELSTIELMRNKINYSLWDTVLDVEYTSNELVSTLKDLAVDYIFYGCEFVVEFTDKLAEHLGLPSNNSKSALARSNKYVMHQTVSNHRITVPKQILLSQITASDNLDDIAKSLGLPFIVKPVNLFGSVGFTLIESVDAFRKLIKNNVFCESNEYIAQEKINGKEYVIDTFSLNGIHHISSIARYEKELFNKNFLYKNIRPIEQQETEYPELEHYIKDVLNAIDFKVGFANTDLFIAENKKIYLLEVNSRVSGAAGTINLTAKLTNGVDQISLLSQAVYKDLPPARLNTKCHSRIIFIYNFIQDKTFLGVNLELITSLGSYQTHIIAKNLGDRLSVGGNLLDSYLYVVLSSTDINQIDRDQAIIGQLEKSGLLLSS